ncbi:MAG: hypothetical protein HY873_03620 [Chloroflexi bacterium]|nr:hypothetical protein [Chloroflexota bacterium]
MGTIYKSFNKRADSLEEIGKSTNNPGLVNLANTYRDSTLTQFRAWISAELSRKNGFPIEITHEQLMLPGFGMELPEQSSTAMPGTPQYAGVNPPTTDELDSAVLGLLADALDATPAIDTKVLWGPDSIDPATFTYKLKDGVADSWGEVVTYKQVQYQQEFLGGVEFEVARSVALGVRYVHRSLPRVPDDTGGQTFTWQGLPELPVYDPKLLPSPRERRDDDAAPGSWWRRTPVKIGSAAAGVILIGGAIFGGVQLFNGGGDGGDDGASVIAQKTPDSVVEIVETVIAQYPAPFDSERARELLEEAGWVSDPGDTGWYDIHQELSDTLFWEESGFQPGFAAPQITIRESGVVFFDLQDASATVPTNLFWNRCGQTLPSGGHMACAQPSAGLLTPGPYVLGVLTVDAPYVDADPAHQYFYGFGVNVDGSAGYPGTPGFDLSARNGLTHGAFIGQSPYSPQYQSWAAIGEWYLGTVASRLNVDIRVLIDGDTLLFLFPGSLFQQASFGWRAIAYGQGGPNPDPATGGADVTGDDPLAPLQQFKGEPLVLGAPSPTADESPAAANGTPTPIGGAEAALNAEIAGGVAAFEIVYRDRDVETLLGRLHPRTIEIYGEEQCRSFLAAGAPDPTYKIQLVSRDGPQDWVYQVDGISTNIPDTIFLDADVTLGGETQRRVLHFTINTNGALDWFTDCGTPLSTP